MKTSFKIVVGIDYTPSSDNAARYAAKMALATGSTLTFHHVYGKGRLGFPKEFAALEKVDESQDEFEESKLQQYIEHLLRDAEIDPGSIEAKYTGAEGDITNELINEAKEVRADFIILGTHGGNGLKENFFGGHAWEAIKKEFVPVLAIPPGAEYSKIKSIVFATEYRQSEIPLIKQLVSYAEGFKAQLIVLHVTNNIFSSEFDHEMFDKFKKEVEEVVSYKKLSISLVKNDTLIEGINNFCSKVQADWLVMSHEKTSFLIGLFNPVSFTKKMSFHTRIPLFAIPDGYISKEKGKKKQPREGHVEYGDFFF